MVTIAESLERLHRSIPGEVKIVAVSKTRPVGAIMEAYAAGQRLFGENKAQELVQKQSQLPKDIQWHFIGHLQTNKVRYIAPFIGLIHSIDSLNLLVEVNREALKNRRAIDCLLQFHIASEQTKFGFSPGEAGMMLDSENFRQLENVRITGVMGMGTFTDDTALTRKEFRTLYGYFQSIKSRFFYRDDAFREISMGMSDDYAIAIEEGSTMVRIGTSVFGSRSPVR